MHIIMPINIIIKDFKLNELNKFNIEPEHKPSPRPNKKQYRIFIKVPPWSFIY